MTFHFSAYEPHAKRTVFCRMPETNTFVAVGVNDAQKMAVIVWMPPQEIEDVDYQVL